MPAEAWQSPFSRRPGISKDILHPRDSWLFTLGDRDFDHIEAPGNLPGAEPAEPLVRATLNQGLLLAVDRGEPTNLRILASRLHLDEQELPAITGYDIDLSAFPSLEIAGENPAVVCPQPIGCDVLPVVTDPLACAARPRPLAVG